MSTTNMVGTSPAPIPEEARLLVGGYPSPTGESAGGLSLFGIDGAGRLARLGEHGQGLEAGYLAASPDKSVVYSVDERKNDGRGPVGPTASIHCFRRTGDGLAPAGCQPALGAFPTYLSVHPTGRWLVVAAHGSFDHVERIVRTADGYAIENVYDDSTVSLYPLLEDGTIGPIADLVILSGYGVDPSPSAQAGGHPQASAHAHCAQFDPSGKFVVVCDKGTDKIHVLRVDAAEGRLQPAQVHICEPGTAPRHVAFHPDAHLMFVTNELASTLTSFRFDPATGELSELDTASTLAPGGCDRANEPADVQVHPGGRFVFVNNRGQDNIAGFTVDAATGALAYASSTGIASSIHPGLAARSFRFNQDGTHLYVADRPADAVVSFTVDPSTGALTEDSRTTVSQPAFVLVL